MNDRALKPFLWPLVCVLTALLPLGCREGFQPVVLEGPAVAPAVDYGELTTVLAAVVDKKGFLHPEALPPVEEALRVQLRRLAVTGPTATPSLFVEPADRLAYWYNARCAWSIELARLAGLPGQMPPKQLERRAFPLDGRLMTLQEIDEAIAELGGWKALVAAPGLALDRAALPREAFGGGEIQRCVDERLSALIADHRRFGVDHRRRRVAIPPILWRFRAELIAQSRRTYGPTGATFITALLPHVHGAALRRLQDAVGYRVTEAAREGNLAVVTEDGSN